MSITDIACFTTVGEFPEDAREEFIELEETFYQAFVDLADGFFADVTENIFEAFRLAASNPLLIVIVSCLIVVVVFHMLPSIFSVFRGRG